MNYELRTTGGPTCGECGSTELLHVNELPLRIDLSNMLEREMLKREIRLAQVFREHLEAVERTYAESILAQEDLADLERGRLLAELEGILAGMSIDVSRWRLFKALRERRFRERVTEAEAALRDLTRQGFSEPPRLELVG